MTDNLKNIVGAEVPKNSWLYLVLKYGVLAPVVVFFMWQVVHKDDVFLDAYRQQVELTLATTKAIEGNTAAMNALREEIKTIARQR
jgi:hypothetical protein